MSNVPDRPDPQAPPAYDGPDPVARRKSLLSGEPKWLPGEPREEGVAAGNIVSLPEAAQLPVRVYINGVLQHEGHDYFVRDRLVLFTRSIIKEGQLSKGRWLAMWLGLFGSYKKNEIIDIEYMEGTTVRLATDVPLLDDSRPEGDRKALGGPGISR